MRLLSGFLEDQARPPGSTSDGGQAFVERPFRASQRFIWTFPHPLFPRLTCERSSDLPTEHAEGRVSSPLRLVILFRSSLSLLEQVLHSVFDDLFFSSGVLVKSTRSFSHHFPILQWTPNDNYSFLPLF